MQFTLLKSNKPDKKYMVSFINPETKRNNTIHFGAKNMDDYTLTNDINQKNRYIRRHSYQNEDWSKNGIYTRGFWSRYLLWNKPSIMESIRDIEKQFKIKINNKIDDIPNKDIEKVINQKPSAYRSMQLAKLKLSQPTTNKNKDNLITWKKEMWQNLTAKLTDGDKFYNCGNKGKNQIKMDLPSVCRPSVRINDKTPKIANEFSNEQIRKAIKIKKQGNIIKWNEL